MILNLASAGRDGSQGKKRVRPDIQGLRAFAVIVVILDHLFLWPSGGFVGVDIFFVISGFLITGLLLSLDPPVRSDRVGWLRFDLAFWSGRV